MLGDPDVHPQPETCWGHVNPIGPRACYDEGKRCAETLFFDYYRHHGVAIKVARIFNTYGPRMHPDDGLIRFMAAPAGVTGPINLGNPGEFAIRELAEAVLALTRSRIVHRPLPEDDQRRPDLARTVQHFKAS